MSRGHRSKRLTLFSALWQPLEGGAERRLRLICEGLAERGWEITVVAGATRIRASGGHADAGLRVLRMAPIRPHAATLPVGPELLSRATIAGLTTDPDVVVSLLASAASLAGIWVGLTLRRPRVLALGGLDLRRHMGSAVGRTQGRFLVRGAQAVVVNAPHMFDQVRPFAPRPGTQQVLIRNGLDPAFRPDPLAVREGPLRVAYYTNGGAAKNDPAFLRVVRACPQLTFRAMGSTDHLDDLPNLARLGWVDDVPAELARADVVINTSTSEGCPNFCQQALAMGRPVLGFANGGVLDLAETYPGDVEVVPIGDVAAMAGRLAGIDWRRQTVHVQMESLVDVVDQWDDLLTGLIQPRSMRQLRR